MLRNSRWLRRHLPALVAIPVVVAFALLALLSARASAPDLAVLCSNKAEACEAVARTFESEQDVDVLVVRMPTSQALAHISSPHSHGEFDLWMGGPAEAYTEAAAHGLLRPASSEPPNSIPSGWKDPQLRWFGVYGGVLSLCVADDVVAPASWEELAGSNLAIAMPNPSTSGTAATFLWSQYERLGSLAVAKDYYAAVGRHVGTYTQSGTVPAQLVAGGRLPSAVTFDSYCLAEQAAGAPVHAVYFADGTGFEIGSVGLLAGTKRPDLAQDFLSLAVSDRGQRVSATSSHQYPTSAALEGNLRTKLDSFATPIFGENIAEAGRHRAELIRMWEEEIYFAGDSPLGPLLRSGTLSLIAGVLAAVAGSVMALAFRLGRGRGLTFICAALPFLFPPVTWALALTYGPFSMNPYGPAIVIVANAVALEPVAFVIVVLALSAVSDRHMVEARALGMRATTIAIRLLAPNVVRGFAMASAVVALLALTDPSLTLIFGGPQRYFASDVLTGIATNRPGAAASALIMSIGVAALVAIPLSKALTARLRRVEPRHLRPPTTWWWGWATVAFGIGVLSLVGVIVSHLARPQPSLMFTTTTGVLLLVVTMALMLAGLIVVAAPLGRRGLRASVYVALAVALSAQISGGVLVWALHRDWLQLAGTRIVPPIVGVDSIYQGLVGVALAYLLLALPMAVLMIIIIRLRVDPLVREMRDAGAYRLRMAVELIPVIFPSLTVALALLTGLVLTRSAPAIFIDLGGKLSIAPLAIIDHVSAAEDGQAFAVSVVTAALIMALLSMAGVLWHHVRRKL
ncbi:extracellular solute-binding protein [Trueperella pecoris]|uniref:extracellular solute-binding protein n=1 Tax=Trueperella pecoris TaxID=2733571 RepID=UPI001ABDE07A|nr:extracellular solute-binding protein [Trueperella pecoris]QTG76131.1 extracellular solute-binding protein [Trueperella pecoris]